MKIVSIFFPPNWISNLSGFFLSGCKNERAKPVTENGSEPKVSEVLWQDPKRFVQTWAAVMLKGKTDHFSENHRGSRRICSDLPYVMFAVIPVRVDLSISVTLSCWLNCAWCSCVGLCWPAAASWNQGLLSRSTASMPVFSRVMCGAGGR